MTNEDLIKKEPWNTVGIEIEYIDIIPSKRLKRVLDNYGCQITHDASVESPSQTLGGLPIKGKTLDPILNKALMRGATIGGEIVSPKISTTKCDWVQSFDEIFSILKRDGERPNTNRGSIHVHVNMPHDLNKDNSRRHSIGILRRSWMFAGYFEQAFFRLGSFGRPHRGRVMDFIYYRPITHNGPQVVRDYQGNDRPALDYDDVLQSKNWNEFFVKCGDILGAEGRYHPSRYMWINYYNLMAPKPHLEFRVFNKTLRWDYLWAGVELCKAFVRACYIHGTKEVRRLTSGEVYGLIDYPANDDQYFQNLIDFLLIEDKTLIDLLQKIWENSSYPEYVDTKVRSHLRNSSRVYYNTDYTRYWPAVLSGKSVVRQPDYIDIHKLNNMGEKVFPEEML